MSTRDDRVHKGTELIEELKDHVLKTMSSDPRGQQGGEGLGNVEIERLAGLAGC